MSAFLSLPSLLPKISIIGVGITEGGVQPGSHALCLLESFLHAIWLVYPTRSISIINTDNINSNGDKIHSYIKGIISSANDKKKPEAYSKWIDTNVVCHNTMVDCIVSQRDTNSHIPRCEPLPTKAFVIEDLKHQLTHVKWNSNRGLHIRYVEGEIAIDHALKLRICNGVHTSVVYVMALTRMKDTMACIHPQLVRFLTTTTYFEP